MTASTGAPASGVAAGADGPVWHTLNADLVLQAEMVDEQSGLSSAEAASRAERFGPNKFDGPDDYAVIQWQPDFGQGTVSCFRQVQPFKKGRW